MDKEFKIKFTLNTKDAEQQASKFKQKMQKNEKVKLDVELGETDQKLKELFATTNALAKKASKNVFWSREKRREFESFYTSLNKSAYTALKSIESEYATLNTQIDALNAKRTELTVELANKDNLASELMSQIQSELDNAGITIGSQEDYNDLIAEYSKAQQQAYSANLQFKAALKAGDAETAKNLQAKASEYAKIRDELAAKLQSFQFGDIATVQVNEKITQLQEEYKKAVKEAEALDKELQKFDSNGAIKRKTEEAAKLKDEFRTITTDLQGNPLHNGTTAERLKSVNYESNNLNAGLKRNGMQLRANNKLTEAWHRIMQRMKFSIYSMLNPLSWARKIWAGFKEQNEDVANTFEMIGKNFIRILSPAINNIVNGVLKGMKYLDYFLQGVQKAFGVKRPISLFDKSVLDDTEKTVDKVEKFTAGFDELHMFDDSKDDKDKLKSEVTLAIPEVDVKWAKTLSDWGEKFGGALEWISRNWKWLAGAFAAFKVGQGLWNLYKMFSGATAGVGLVGGIKAAGLALKGFLAQTMYLGSKGPVSVGKFLGGITLLTGGIALASTSAIDAGRNWQDLNGKQKALKVGMVGLGSAAAGLGAFMLGASGPVGWAIAGGVALASFTLGMAQTQDGIGSVKKETEKLAEAQGIAKIANDNYLTAMDNLSLTMNKLEEAEKRTGLSGADLAEQVKSGKLEIENMTAAQYDVYNAYLQNEEMIKQLKTATEQKTEADKQEVIQSLKVEAANAIKSKSYDALRESVVKAWEEGSISAEEGADIMSRALANANNKTQEVFGESIPNEMKAAFDPNQYESGWRKFGDAFKIKMNEIGNWFSTKWQGVKSWWDGLWSGSKVPEPSTPSNYQGSRWTGPEYAVGTNYVPNDQLAMVHKGEAIIPAKYNRPQNHNDNGQLAQTLNAMNAEIANLRSTIQQGIPVSGEFRQRGNDLVAVVDRTKSRRGAQPISNNAYAR